MRNLVEYRLYARDTHRLKIDYAKEMVDRMTKKLLIVESGHKSKVIAGFLDSTWTVRASVGHVRELMDTKKVPAAKKEDYGVYSINVKNFDPLFVVSPDRAKVVKELKDLAAKADEIYLGTDPDREGEAIAWHLRELLGTKKPIYRVTWNEITKKAIADGIKNKRQINQQEVDASLARQIYDRLFGFSISPHLWQVVFRGASGGRVQSPALRLISNREQERLAFVKATYMSLTGLFTVGAKGDELAAKLQSIGARKIAVGSSFDSKGQVKGKEFVLDKSNIDKIQAFLKKGTYEVEDISTKPYSRKPPMPYTTSSFQQDVGTRTRLGSKQIMSVAQRLYDEGYITYMRTDSPGLSQEGTDAARAAAVKLFGKAAVPTAARVYKSKAKNAQEGHEAIRPTVDAKNEFIHPTAIKAKLDKIDKNAYKVYECIYNRTVASQMNDAKGFTTTVKIGSTNLPEDKKAIFSTAATTFTDLGWMALTKPVSEDEEENNTLSAKVETGDPAKLKKLAPNEHSTTPPARFTEPQLVAKLEELGIGRPSTYASIVTVNQTRGYVKKKGQQLYPTWTGMKVAQYLEGKIPAFVAYDATATMEDELDKIESGTLQKNAFLKTEWARIQKDVLSLQQNIDWKEVERLSTIDLHNGYVIRVNRYGEWLEDTSVPMDAQGRRPGLKLGETESVADYDFSDPAVCGELMAAAANRVDARELGVLSSGEYKGWTVTARDGKFGSYFQALPPETVAAYAKGEKAPAKAPKAVNHPIPEGLDLKTVALVDAEPIFAEVKLPRWSDDGKWIVGVNKKGGNYVGFKASAKSRNVKFKSMPDEIDPRTVDFKEAKKIWEEND